MNRRLQSWAHALLALYAALWPWAALARVPLGHASHSATLGWFVYTPLYEIPCVPALRLLLGMLFVLHVASTRRLRVPFELAWPLAALLALNLVQVFSKMPGAGDPMLAVTRVLFEPHLLTLLFFLVVVHFAQSRAWVGRYLWLAGVSVACGAVLSLAGPALGIVPTAYSVDSGATLTFAPDLASGVFTLLAGLVITGYYAAARRLEPWKRATCSVLAALLAATLLRVAATGAPGFASLFAEHYRAPTPLDWARWLVGLWLLARVAAKVEIARREHAGGIHGLLLALLAVTALQWAAAGRLPVADGFLLGIAGAYALPEIPAPSPARPWTLAGIAPFAALVACNLFNIQPDSARDPRNYNVNAMRQLLLSRPEQAAQLADYFEQRYPAERATHYWRAFAELAQDRPYRAALEFGESLTPVPAARLLVPPPDGARQDAFLRALRDYCSALPGSGRPYAYEQALFAAGDAAAAVQLLSLRAMDAQTLPAGMEPPGEAVRGPLEDAVAFLLGAEHAGDALGALSAEDLLALLRAWGAVAEPAPAGVPEECLPLVCVARYGAHAADLGAFGRRNAATERRPGRFPLQSASGPGARWSEVAEAGQRGWETRLALSRGGASVATVRMAPDCVVEIPPPDAELDTAVPEPAILRVWLPRP